MFSNHLQKEIELCSKFDIVVTDRSLIDYVAYSYFVDSKLSQVLFTMCKQMFHSYDEIYFKSIRSNNYMIDDGIRDTNTEYRFKIEEKMLNLYSVLLNEFNVKFIKI
jgi:hypothetical protein